MLPSLSQPALIPISAISPYDETTKLRREVVRIRRLCEAKLAAAEEEYRLRAERLHIELTGTMEEKEAMLKQASKEERIEFLHRQSVRRMLNKEVSRSFVQWATNWEAALEERQKLSRIERAARMFKSPALGAAFRWWAHISSTDKHERQREQLVLAVASLEEQLQKAEQEKAKALQRQLVDLVGGTEEKEALRQEQEREERVELMRRQVTRRIMHKGLADGWMAWVDLWEAKAYAIGRLREVGNKLRSPALADHFAYWAHDALDTKRAATLAALEAESRTLSGQLQKARFEAGQLSLVKTQLEDERDHLRERVNELHARLQETMDSLHASSTATLQLENLQKALASAEAEAETLEAEKEALQNASVVHRKESERLLEQLLAEQRKGFEEELTQLKDQAWARSEQEAKEARIALLHRQALNRAKHHEILRGWTQWLYWYEFRADLLRKMDEGARKTERVRLSMGFHSWLLGAFAMREAKVRAEAMRGQTSLEASLAQARSELAASEAEKLALLTRLAALQGHDPSAALEDVERLHQATLAAEKGERVELLRRQIGRRMLNQGLSSGWSAWLELWQAKVYATNRLHQVAKKLHAPELALAFDFWTGDVADAKKLGLLQAAREREAAAATDVAGVRAEMEQMRASYERRLEEAANAKDVALERMRIELVGSLEEQQAMRAERAKEEAVERRRQQSLRRLMNSGLTRGWSAWFELWEAKSYAKQRLKQVAKKLHAPDLSSYFDEWTEDLAAAKHAAHAAALEAESKSFEVQLRRARFENNQLEIVQAAHLDELQSLRSRVELLVLSNRDQQARIDADDGLKAELKEVRKQCAAATEAAEAAEAAKVEADEDLLKHQKEMQELIQRLLARQRATFEEDMKRMGMRMAAAEEKRDGADAANDEARDQIDSLQSTLAATQAAAQKAADEAQAALEAATARADQERIRFEGRITELLTLAERAQQEAVETKDAADKARQASEAKAAEDMAQMQATLTADLQQANARAEALGEELSQLREASAEAQGGLEAELASAKEATEQREAERAALAGANQGLEEEAATLHEKIDQLDKELKECQKALKAAQKALKDAQKVEEPPRKKGTSILGRIDIDESPDAPPLTEQIATALRDNAGRVLDLFREWDTNGDGEVSRKEFHEAMAHLGFEVPKVEIDKLFDSWDTGGEGSLDYKELSKILKTKPATSKLKAAGAALKLSAAGKKATETTS